MQKKICVIMKNIKNVNEIAEKMKIYMENNLV
jgi:hypothetical protein